MHATALALTLLAATPAVGGKVAKSSAQPIALDGVVRQCCTGAATVHGSVPLFRGAPPTEFSTTSTLRWDDGSDRCVLAAEPMVVGPAASALQVESVDLGGQRWALPEPVYALRPGLALELQPIHWQITANGVDGFTVAVINNKPEYRGTIAQTTADAGQVDTLQYAPCGTPPGRAVDPSAISLDVGAEVAVRVPEPRLELRAVRVDGVLQPDPTRWPAPASGAAIQLDLYDRCEPETLLVPLEPARGCDGTALYPGRIMARWGDHSEVLAVSDGTVAITRDRCERATEPELIAIDDNYAATPVAAAAGRLDLRPLAKLPSAHLVLDLSRPMEDAFFAVRDALSTVETGDTPPTPFAEVMVSAATHDALSATARTARGELSRWARTHLSDRVVSQQTPAPAATLAGAASSVLGGGPDLGRDRVVYVVADNPAYRPSALTDLPLPPGVAVDVLVVDENRTCRRSRLGGWTDTESWTFACVTPSAVGRVVMGALSNRCGGA